MGDFDRVNGTSVELDRAQRRIQDGARRGNPSFQDGAELSIKITSDSPLKVGHRLGHKPQGFMVIGESGSGVASLTATDMGAKSITFELSIPAGAPSTSKTYRIRVY